MKYSLKPLECVDAYGSPTRVPAMTPSEPRDLEVHGSCLGFVWGVGV